MAFIRPGVGIQCPSGLIVAVGFFASGLAAAPSPPPLLFLGDKDYPPVAYLDNGIAKGMDVELATALSGPLHRTVQIELMDWNLAQEKVLKGEADGLIGMSISDDRRKMFDFAAPTFTREFRLVVREHEMTIHDVVDLNGKRVGVTAGGFPRKFFETQPGVHVVLIDNYEDGFRKLAAGTIDAMGADLWVAAYLMEKNDVHGLTFTGKPFATTQEAVAVRKGNAALLNDLTRATTTLRANGTLARIQANWRPQEMVFASRERVRHLFLLGGGIALLVLFAGMTIWILTLKNQIRIRRQAESALKESEERYRDLTEAAFEGICISEKGMILDVNDQLLKMFGYQRDEMIGRQILGFVAPAWRDRVAAAVRAGGEEIYGHQLLRKDGSPFFAEARAKTVRAGDRTLRMTALRDVTDRKQMEELANTQVQVMEMIVAGAPMSATLDALLRMIEAQSPEMLCSLLLLDPDGVHVRHGAAPSLPEEYVRAVDGSAIGDRAGSCGTAAFRREAVFVADIATDPLWADYKHLALPHGLRACWAAPIFDAQRNVLGTFAIYYRRPATPNARHLHLIEMATHTAAVCIAKHRTDLALRDSEKRFRSYFELAAVGFSITAPDKRLMAVNHEYCRIVGFSEAELLKKTWADFTHPDDLKGNDDLFVQAVAGKIDAYTLNKRLIRKDGQVIYATISVRCVRRPDGSPDYFVSLLLDVTERERAFAREREARLEYTLQLIASQEAERARIAGELHDSLGQSLSLIKNRAQLALLEQSLSDTVREQLEAISTTTAQAVDEVRQISRDLHPYQLAHLGLTRALETLIDNAAAASDIHFNKKFDPVDTTFSRDAATNLYRIVQEGINNILKYSRARNADVTLERDVHDVQLTIHDDGCGFAAGDRGKGMGLKNIAERTRILGGELELASAPGKGTRIKITIPISAEAE